MKKIILFLFIFLCIFNSSLAENSATQTDLEELYEFEDEDCGYIEIEMLERKVFLEFLKEPTYYGEEVTLIAILLDFRDTDIYHFEWQESKDGNEWWIITGEHESTYTFIINSDNIDHYWRVKVYLEED